MENWISVYEYNRKEKDLIEWLFKLLEEEKIPYKEELKENWTGYRMPTYHHSIILYVPQEYKEKVESYLEEHDNSDNIVYEEAEELKNVSDEEKEQLNEIKKGRIAQKMLAWIPIVMVIIVIICGIISSFMYGS